MKKFSFIFFVISLLISTLACASLDGFTEKSTIKIIQPISNFRDTRDIGEKEYLDVALSILVTSNKRDKEALPVSIIWNGSAPVTCYVIVNQETPCGTLPMYKGQTGQQTLSVNFVKINGETISDKIVFTWEPLRGFDTAFLKVAQLLGSQNPTMGMIFLIIAVLIIFSAFVALRTKSIFGVIIVFVTGIIGVILVYSFFNPTLGVNLYTALLAFLGTSFVFSLIGYAVNRGYGLSVGGKIQDYGYDQFGRPTKRIVDKGLVDFGPRYQNQPGQYEISRIPDRNGQHQPGVPQIESQYQQFLPPPNQEEFYEEEQEYQPRGLARLLSALLNQGKKQNPQRRLK